MAESIPADAMHAHDDHHHAEQSIWSKYVFSTDHKMIAMQYMFTGMAMALIGGFMAYAFRMQLAFPGMDVPGYGTVTGGQLQCARHQPRHRHDLLGRDAGVDRSIRQLPHPADGRLRRHGLSEAQSALLSDLSCSVRSC